MVEGQFGIPGLPGQSDVAEKPVAPAALIRPLRAVASGGSGDINFLAARAADAIESLLAELDKRHGS